MSHTIYYACLLKKRKKVTNHNLLTFLVLSIIPIQNWTITTVAVAVLSNYIRSSIFFVFDCAWKRYAEPHGSSAGKLPKSVFVNKCEKPLPYARTRQKYLRKNDWNGSKTNENDSLANI